MKHERGGRLTTYILPGMGADVTMYGPEFKKLKGVHYLNWPTYNNEKTIEDISLRIIHEYNITSSDIVGGSSLGSQKNSFNWQYLNT
jgi:hypothetical protein